MLKPPPEWTRLLMFGGLLQARLSATKALSLQLIQLSI